MKVAGGERRADINADGGFEKQSETLQNVIYVHMYMHSFKFLLRKTFSWCCNWFI